MSLGEYLEGLDSRLQELGELVTSWAIEREIDTNLGIGFIKGHITFVDGSRLEFTEQLPIERRKFRLHYMDARNGLIVRWDSAPHHREMATFPFHRHTPGGVAEHGPINVIEALDTIVETLRL
jgi:hypothetical protein